MYNKTTVYLRADGNSTIGLGHLHRLIALTEILSKNFNCIFITKNPLPGIEKLIVEAGAIQILQLDDSHKTEYSLYSSLLKKNDIVVLDGYQFDTEYQQMIKQFGCSLVCVDDLNSGHFVSDLIINPAGGIDPDGYSKEQETTLLLGPSYALIKKPFLKNRIKREFTMLPESVMVCMGGADPQNYTERILNTCLQLPFKTYNVIIGEAYQYRDTLSKYIENKNSKNVIIKSNLSVYDMVEVMSKSAVAICSASGITYEYLSIGGELYIIQTASNQKLLFDYLLNEGLAFNFNDCLVSRHLAKCSYEHQGAVFDGYADKRLLSEFNILDFQLNVKVRKAVFDDCKIIFDWVNDSETRKQSYNPAPVAYENHTIWFKRKLEDPNTFFYIFEYKALAFAQVRFDIQNEAVISYSLNSEYRGRGWGIHVLKEGIKLFRNQYCKEIEIIGYVKKENAASNTVFQKLGFRREETTKYPNSYKYRL